MPCWAGPCLSIVIPTHRIGKMEAMLGGSSLSYRYFLQKNGGEGCHPGQDLVVSSLFPTKEWRKRMSCRTGPRLLCFYFLQKNGGIGCLLGQDLVCILMISYRRMVERDAISSRTLFLFLNFLQKNGGGGCYPGQDLVKCFLAIDISVMWWHRPFEFCNVLDRHERDLQDPIRAVFSTARSGESNDTWRNYLFYRSTHRLYNLPKFLPSLPNTT